MSEWDDFGSESSTPSGGRGATTGGWNAAMTIFPLITVTAVSFATAFATGQVEQRPIWMLSLIFALPMLALMLTVFLVEKVTSSMTPQVSRKAQAGVAAAVVALSAIAGCACHLSNTEVTVAQNSWSNTIIILDKSGSMCGSLSGNMTKHDAATQAVLTIMNQMDDKVNLGLVTDRGDWNSHKGVSIDIAPLSQNRQLIEQEVRSDSDGNTWFQDAVEKACTMMNNHKNLQNLKIIMVTDGYCGFDETEPLAAMKAAGATFSYIRIGADANENLENLVAQTGGTSMDVEDLDQLTSTMMGIVSEVTYCDALREINMSLRTEIVMGILMLFIGLLIGFALALMFSLQGQFRFQIILSPLMAILSFCLLSFGQQLIPNPILREGIAFSLFGVVFMKKNLITRHTAGSTPVTADESW